MTLDVVVVVDAVAVVGAPSAAAVVLRCVAGCCKQLRSKAKLQGSGRAPAIARLVVVSEPKSEPKVLKTVIVNAIHDLTQPTKYAYFCAK